MILDAIDQLARDVIKQNASSKWGRSDYTSPISSQQLRTLVESLVAILPVAKAALECEESEYDRSSLQVLDSAVGRMIEAFALEVTP